MSSIEGQVEVSNQDFANSNTDLSIVKIDRFLQKTASKMGLLFLRIIDAVKFNIIRLMSLNKAFRGTITRKYLLLLFRTVASITHVVESMLFVKSVSVVPATDVLVLLVIRQVIKVDVATAVQTFTPVGNPAVC